MGRKWKPVEATEIKDINIIREVIAQIRKPIPQEVYDRLAERDRQLDGLMRPLDPEVRRRSWNMEEYLAAGNKE